MLLFHFSPLFDDPHGHIVEVIQNLARDAAQHIILDAGLATLTQKGIAKTTLDDVCKAAGLSKGGLVHYFKTKDVLFKAVFKEFFQRIFKRGEETMAQFDTPLEQILSFEWLYDESDEEGDALAAAAKTTVGNCENGSTTRGEEDSSTQEGQENEATDD